MAIAGLLSRSRAFIALGSNVGDSAAILGAAMRRLAGFSVAPLHKSSLWQTTPIDCPPGSPWFVNAVVALVPEANETPESLLDRLQALEREFGRRPRQVLNEPRPLDLDLLAFGGEIRATSRLTLPHPRAAQRRFVLAPLAEIAPDLVLPGQVESVRHLLAHLGDDGAATRLGVG